MTIDLRITAENASGQLVETDPNARLAAASATTLSITAMARNEVCSRAYDGGGAGFYSGQAYAEGELYVASSTAGSAYLCIAFSTRDSSASAATVSGDLAGLFCAANSTTGKLNLYQFLYESGVDLTGAGVASGTLPDIGTRCYYRIGFISSLGRYGGVVVQFFSDSDRTTLIRCIVLARTAASTYRYFHVIQSYSSASAVNWTGDTANVTIYQPAVGIDLTVATGGFTQTDPSAHIADYADCIVVTTLNTNEDAYHYKDYGASYFNGNYILTGALNVTAFATGSGTMFTLLSLMNTINDGNNTDDKQCVVVDYVSASTYTIKLREVAATTGYNSASSSTLNTNQPYWLKEWRDTSVGTYGTLYLAIYNDPTMLSLVETLSLTLHDNGTPDVAAFQYFYPLQSWNTASSRTTTFTFGGVAALKTVGGALAGDIVTTASFVGSGGAVSALEGSVVTTASFIGASVNEGVLAGTSVVTASFVGELFSAGSANLNGNVVTTASFAGASIATGSLAGNAVTTCSFVADTTPSLTAKITCRITKVNSAGQEVGATGLTPTLKFYLVSNSYYRDFSDSAFKPIASCVTLTANMTERNATLAAGRYDYTLQTYGLGSGAKTEYGYDIDATISSSETYMNEGSMIFLDGVEVLPGLTAAQDTTLTALPSAAQNATAVVDRVIP